MEAWKIACIGLGIIALVLFAYGVYERYKVNKTDTPVDNNTSTGMSKNQKLVFMLFLSFLVVGIIVYLILTNQKKNKFMNDPMTPDEFNQHKREHLAFHGGVRAFYDKAGELTIISELREGDKRLFTPHGTSHDFMAQDTKILDPVVKLGSQIRTTMVNLNRNKEFIQGGGYSVHEHTNYDQWVKSKSYLRKLPVGSPESEAMMMAQMAAEAGIDATEFVKMRNAAKGMTAPSDGQDREDDGKFGAGVPLQTEESDATDEDLQRQAYRNYTPRRRKTYYNRGRR